MLVRYLPLILILSALFLALAPLEAAAQEFYLGRGQRTEGTPSDREAHNGVFDHKKKPAAAGRAAKVELGEVQASPRSEGVRPEDAAALYVTQAEPYTTDPPPKTGASKSKTPPPNPADQQPRPKTNGAPVNSSSQDKPLPPGADPRQVRPAEAFPPERVEHGRVDKTPQAPDRAGVDTQAIPPKEAPKDDPRSVEERKDPGD